MGLGPATPAYDCVVAPAKQAERIFPHEP
jgi:hypothetical protein